MSRDMIELGLQGGLILNPEHVEVVNRYSRPALARRTVEVYRSFARQFDDWRRCNSYPLTFPADPSVVIAWLANLAAAGRPPGTIGIALAAVKYAHQQLDMVFEGGAAVANAMRHIRRDDTRPQDQAAPLRQSLLIELLRQPMTSMRDMRDAALLSLAYAFALRRDELATLDYAEIGAGKSVLTIDEAALVIDFRRSKTAQESGETVAIPRDANSRLTGAVLRWVREAGIAPGSPLLRGITSRGDRVTGNGISGDLVSRVVRDRVRRHYIETGHSVEDAERLAAPFSGHSARVGFVVSATEAGIGADDIARVTRHRPGSAMVRHYGSQASQLLTSPHRDPKVGL